MRPELKEYNYDWMMGKTLEAAANVPSGTRKETDLAMKYLPNYQGVADTFFNSGDPGIQLLHLLTQYFENILTARKKGKKIAVTTFCQTPAIFYAMDVVPVTFEILTALGGLIWKRGLFDYMDYCCEVGMTETSCSSQRGAMGAYLARLGEEIDFVVCDTPGVCDTNANAFSFAATYLDKPFYQLNYPSTLGDRRSEKYHLDDFKEMICFLENHTGQKMDYDRLAEILEEVERQDELIGELEDMYMLAPVPIPPLFNLAMYAGRFTFCGHKAFTQLLASMHAWAETRAQKGLSGLKSGKERLRVYMCYIDHYTVDMNFWNYLEDRGIASLGSILTRNFRDVNTYTQRLPGSGYHVDVSSPESMIDSIAQMNARLPMARSIRGPYDKKNMWLEETLAIAKLCRAQCVIYNGTPGCRNTWGMVKPFARDIESQGYPVHIMYGDAFDDRVESWESTRERLDEFFQVRGLL
jgi:benzoyl-CoA reductase subunit B